MSSIAESLAKAGYLQPVADALKQIGESRKREQQYALMAQNYDQAGRQLDKLKQPVITEAPMQVRNNSNLISQINNPSGNSNFNNQGEASQLTDKEISVNPTNRPNVNVVSALNPLVNEQPNPFTARIKGAQIINDLMAKGLLDSNSTPETMQKVASMAQLLQGRLAQVPKREIRQAGDSLVEINQDPLGGINYKVGFTGGKHNPFTSEAKGKFALNQETGKWGVNPLWQDEPTIQQLPPDKNTPAGKIPFGYIKDGVRVVTSNENANTVHNGSGAGSTSSSGSNGEGDGVYPNISKDIEDLTIRQSQYNDFKNTNKNEDAKNKMQEIVGLTEGMIHKIEVSMPGFRTIVKNFATKLSDGTTRYEDIDKKVDAEKSLDAHPNAKALLKTILHSRFFNTKNMNVGTN